MSVKSNVINAYYRFLAASDGSKFCFYIVWSNGLHTMLTEKQYLEKRKHNATPPYSELILVPLSQVIGFSYIEYKTEQLERESEANKHRL